MRRLLAVLLVLAALAVAADVGGRWYAQQRAEQALAQHLPADADPAVRIHGFSFLLQALPGHYAHVTVGSNDLGTGPIDHIRATADLYGIDYPLPDAIRRTVGGVTIGRVDLRAVVPAADLGAALGIPDLSLSPAATGIEMHTAVSAAGTTIPIAVAVTVAVRDKTVHLAATPVSVGPARVPAALAQELRQRLTTSIPLPQLPFDVTAATVSVSGGNLVIAATATNLRAADVEL